MPDAPPTRPRLLYFQNWVDPIAVRVLEADPGVELVRASYDDPRDANDAALASAHGYQVQARGELQEPWFGDASLLSRAPSLLAMSSTGAGYDYIDVDACTKAGVVVCNQAGTNTEAVAEHTLGFILALSKRIMVADRLTRRGLAADRFGLQGNDIFGKTVGVIGLGTIGSRVAQLCRDMFRMRVLAYDPYLSAEAVERRGAAKAQLQELLRESDYVTVHCPRSKETLGMIGAAEFALMKPSSYFVTTARGGIHDEHALAVALSEGRLAGAAVDVFLEEPPPVNHPLLALDNVIVTPHTAGITAEALSEMARGAAEQWLHLFAGRVPPRLINPGAWDTYSRRFEAAFGFLPDRLP